MNGLAKSKVCPRRGNGVKMGFVHTRFALAFLPVALLAIIFGLSGPIAAGVAGAVGATYGMGLKRS